jgi:hypothetical protein
MFDPPRGRPDLPIHDKWRKIPYGPGQPGSEQLNHITLEISYGREQGDFEMVYQTPLCSKEFGTESKMDSGYEGKWYWGSKSARVEGRRFALFFFIGLKDSLRDWAPRVC